MVEVRGTPHTKGLVKTGCNDRQMCTVCSCCGLVVVVVVVVVVAFATATTVLLLLLYLLLRLKLYVQQRAASTVFPDHLLAYEPQKGCAKLVLSHVCTVSGIAIFDRR